MLTDCIAKDRSVSELSLVRQGASAAMARSVRDRFTQAILSIHASIVGADGTLDEVLDNEPFKGITASLGTGLWLGESSEAVGFDLNRLRYEKIILAFDDSPEGVRIQTEVVSLLIRFISPVVASGLVYTAAMSQSDGMSEDEFATRIMKPQTRNLSSVEFEPARS